MTDDRELSLILDRWLSDGPTEMPDRVVDVVTIGISRRRQRPVWRLDWRRYAMNTNVKLAAALVAVLAVAIAGYTMLPGGSTGVGGPAPTPSPTAIPSSSGAAVRSPSAAPSASAPPSYPAWFTPPSEANGAGILPAGKVTTRFTPVFTFTVPAGWVNDTNSADAYALFPDSTANQAGYARSRGLSQGIIMSKVDSPWVICGGLGDTHGTTSAELVDSLVANEAIVTSKPVDVTIGGLTGRQVDARLAGAGTCPSESGGPPEDLKDYRGRFIFLDVPGGGKILIIVDSVTSADFEAFLAEAMPVIESIDFTP